MTTLVPVEQRTPVPIRIVRGGAGLERTAAFQPEWEPLFRPDLARATDRWAAGDVVDRAARHFDLALSVALSVCVSGFVTLVLTVRAVGLAPDWAQTWLTTLKLSLLIGLPARFLFEPYVERLVALFVEPPRP